MKISEEELRKIISREMNSTLKSDVEKGLINREQYLLIEREVTKKVKEGLSTPEKTTTTNPHI